MTQMNLHSVVYVPGATDTSHVIIAQRQAGALSGLNLPYRGGEPAGLTLSGNVRFHPGALCVNTNSSNTACTLEFNNVAWRAVPDVAPITSFSITSNVVTIIANNNFTGGETVSIAGMGIATYLNGLGFTVLNAVLSTTPFVIAFTHASS